MAWFLMVFYFTPVIWLGFALYIVFCFTSVIKKYGLVLVAYLVEGIVMDILYAWVSELD